MPCHPIQQHVLQWNGTFRNRDIKENTLLAGHAAQSLRLASFDSPEAPTAGQGHLATCMLLAFQEGSTLKTLLLELQDQSKRAMTWLPVSTAFRSQRKPESLQPSFPMSVQSEEMHHNRHIDRRPRFAANGVCSFQGRHY